MTSNAVWASLSGTKDGGTYGQVIAEEWPIDRTPHKYKRARRKLQRARLRAEYEADSGSESDITGAIDRLCPLSDSHSSASSRSPSPPATSTKLTVATESHVAEKLVATDGRPEIGEHTHDERESVDGHGSDDGPHTIVQEAPKHLDDALGNIDCIGVQPEKRDGPEAIHDASPVARRRTLQRACKLDQHKRVEGPEQEAPTYIEPRNVGSPSQNPIPQLDPCTVDTQQGKRKRAASMEDNAHGPRRSQRIALEREKPHAKGEGSSNDHAVATGTAKKGNRKRPATMEEAGTAQTGKRKKTAPVDEGSAQAVAQKSKGKRPAPAKKPVATETAPKSGRKRPAAAEKLAAKEIAPKSQRKPPAPVKMPVAKEIASKSRPKKSAPVETPVTKEAALKSKRKRPVVEEPDAKGTTQKERKRPAPVEENDHDLRRSERVRLKREQPHEEAGGPANDEATIRGPAHKRARMTMKQTPRKG